ncbi:MAG TPA: ABC transporter permease [Candidatus Acidoferrales bacterium]|nr:ABC transporter permease [Candidatus Acidoferrales bacterium]
MFWRILWRLLYASRGRLALAILAVASGAAVCAALLNVDLDATDKLTREFRALGANVVVSATQNGDAAGTMDANLIGQISDLHLPDVVAAAPYLYLSANAKAGENNSGVIVAGTLFDEVARMNSWWKVDGLWVASRDDRTQCMIGELAASRLGLTPGKSVTVTYAGRAVTLQVRGIVTTGSSEDSQIFVVLPVAQELSGLGDRITLIQIMARGSAAEIQGVIHRLSTALPAAQVRPLRQIAEAEGQLLARIRGLLAGTVGLILVLTALGVLAAMAGLAVERRRDVGLMKALGGPVRRIMRFFLAEATAIAFTGGIAGCLVGMALSEWIGERIFSVSISPRLIVIPATLALMIVVSLAGALPLRLLGRVRPAEILRGE